MLARREHSIAEVRTRLEERFGGSALIDAAIERLIEERLLSDERFAEAFTRMHANRGHGPVRILHELGQRGIAATLAAAAVEPRDARWTELARTWCLRRFGAEPPVGAGEWQRRARHLRQRGFSEAQVRAALREGGED